MAQHTLSLEAPDTTNQCLLRVVDTSIYNSLLEASCMALEITLPGMVSPVVLGEEMLYKGFILNLTACDLGLQVNDCDTDPMTLEDGIYIIKYSLSPNEYVYVEYNHLRITNALNKIQEIYCELDLGYCEPSKVIKDKLRKLEMIEQYLKAAKAKVEFCHEPEKGINLYRYGLKLLNDMLCLTC